MTAIVLRGDARHLPLPDGSVDLIVTSPPFWQLRSYTDGGVHYSGQIGSEPTIAEWLAVMLDCTREWARVLKPTGSLFVELGDSYTNKCLNDAPHRYVIGCVDKLRLIKRAEIPWHHVNGLPEAVTDRVRRSHSMVFHLVRQPRYYAAVDEIREPQAGSHQTSGAAGRGRGHGGDALLSGTFSKDGGFNAYRERNGIAYNPLGKLPGSVWTIPSQPLTVPTHLGIDHFAAYPMELPRRCILGWSPPGVCTGCGEGRRPVRGVDWSRVPHTMAEKRVLTETERLRFAELFCDWQAQRGLTGREIAELFPSRTGGMTGCVANWRAGANILMPEQAEAIEARFGALPAELLELVNLTRSVPVSLMDAGNSIKITGRHETDGHRRMASAEYQRITGYACACPQPDAPTRPAVVLDPFGGTGTTALVAAMHGRTGITIDRSADYSRLAAWRTTDPAQRAAAMGVPKPPPIPDGMEALF